MAALNKSIGSWHHLATAAFIGPRLSNDSAADKPPVSRLHTFARQVGA